ncbi:type I-E CRISPR-associated protein Cas5/CasD [Chromohalobacter japonicus]|uniref:type I-E CRISPR-associated protein Cas5/CasD n=1 Tax=Chromohalobacter japonicus TaxID=223900 RepID=UPI0015BBDFAA|nr:type I-E CRISPR-associated protein Cas5/CasD [Chromohalobacter japonicus]MCK0753368.1 type I-E CRISPR-associated protein Cas5/CasD [Chromohalobacter japonicus]NWO09714.1 type I-E CRISPR-associated protein Cas5/CasD [Chromohalobacter salexigens]
MTEYLVFRLYAPLVSWGEAAVGETRPTATYPGRSAIIGLLGAALGVRRDDDERQRQLRESVRIAVKQRSPGTLLRDYHTAQVPAAQSKVTYRTRRDELSAPRKVINTILSSRDYRCDGLWTVAVWLTSQAELSLADLEQALKKPRFLLYLGRKACPPAAPLAPRRETCAQLRDALDAGFPPLLERGEEDERRALRLPESAVYAWDGEADAFDGDQHGVASSEVWDVPLNRRRWQFGPRTEFRRMVGQEESR